MKKVTTLCLSLGMTLIALSVSNAQTIADFDSGADPSLALERFGGGPGPAVLNSNGNPGGYLQLTQDVGSSHNWATFASDPGNIGEDGVSKFEFDFRIAPLATPSADGISFSYAPTSRFGQAGNIGSAPFTAEDPHIPGGLGFGFDTWSNEGAWDTPGIGTGSDYQEITLFWDDAIVLRIDDTRDLSPPLLLDDSAWHHVDGTVDFTSGIVNMTVDSTVVFEDLEVPGLTPFENRIMFAARTGGENADHGIDNLNVGAGIVIPFEINGSGETYFQDFDEMETGKRLPKNWSGETTEGSRRFASSLGLVDGPLEGAVLSAAGLANVGGNPERFETSGPDRLATWHADLNNSTLMDEDDVVQDGATDRALGNARVLDDDPGTIEFEIEIAGSVLRALTLGWDLEIWGGDPENVFRGSDGAGFAVDVSVGGTSYFTQTVTSHPGDLFFSSFDGADTTNDPTLINGNDNAVRGNSSGIVEVSSADGAVGNLIQLTFDANHGAADGGWIPAVDNVQLRALAAGDAQADGDVDPADLIQLLAGGAFGQGNIDATWGQGDFDNDGDFDGTDILAVVQGLAGEFPKNYAHDPSNGVPDVLINPATGNITLDTNGTTIGSIVMDSAAGIFNGPNSPSWDAPGDFAADIDTQISMPISFTNPGYTGVDDLGDGIIGDLAPGFDILADLTIKYLDPNGDLLDAEAHVVPEPNSLLLLGLGSIALLAIGRRRLKK